MDKKENLNASGNYNIKLKICIGIIIILSIALVVLGTEYSTLSKELQNDSKSQESYDDGYYEGYLDGKTDGYSDGYSEGWDDCIEESDAEYAIGYESYSIDDYNTEMVYVTDTGEKYHLYGCHYLRSSCNAISLSDAQNLGYTPCSYCW